MVKPEDDFMVGETRPIRAPRLEVLRRVRALADAGELTYGYQAKLAREFGVSRAYVNAIVRREGYSLAAPTVAH